MGDGLAVEHPAAHPIDLPLGMRQIVIERGEHHAGQFAGVLELDASEVRVTLNPHSRPDRTLPPVTIAALLAREPDPPAGEEPVDWLPVNNPIPPACSL